MIDEDALTIWPVVEAPAFTLLPEPESIPEPEPAPEPEPEPEAPARPVEVVSIEDLLDRLAGDGQSGEETEEPSQEIETEEEVPFEALDIPSESVFFSESESIRIAGMDTVLENLDTLQKAVEHPMLTTSFEDYTVTEGLLLLLLLSVVVMACVKMLKGGFAWLR